MSVDAALQQVAGEGVLVVRGTVVNQLQQQLLGNDVDLQRLQLLAGGGGTDGQVGDAAGVVGLHIGGEVGGALQGGGADHGDVGTGGQMLLEDLGNGQVHGDVAPAHDDVILTDVLQVAGDAGQSLHVALILALVLSVIAEGRQDAQTAVLAAQLPILTGTQVVQQGLILLMDDDTDIGDTGVDIAGQHEVDQAIAAAEGQRTGVAGTSQLSQFLIRAVGEENAVQIIHACSPPLTSSRIMAAGLTTAFSPTVTPPATTATPQPSSPVGAAPTVAPASMTAFSATMAY